SEWMFDHTLVVAEDDPHLDKFKALASLGLNDVGGVCDIRIVEAVGCEKFAELAYKEMATILHIFKNGNGSIMRTKSYTPFYHKKLIKKLKEYQIKRQKN
ncbi:MAG: hypothetical protein EBW86_09330, partial [Rhodobacteraceae bacterium]|nr:hypothetical protein [Paracoccaceae bacterium]